MELLHPRGQISGCQRGGFGNRLSSDSHGERFRLQPGAIATGACLGELVLPQEDADVLLVAFLFEPLQEREDPEIAATLVMQQEVALACRDVAPGRVEVDAPGTGRLAQQSPPSFVPWLRPGIERAVGEGAAPIGHDE